jgi:hypothetical protein
VVESSQEEILRWGTIDFSQLLEGLVPLNDIVTGITAFTDTLAGILDILSTAIEVAGLFFIDMDDVFAAFYTTLYDLVLDTVQQLTQTGIYNLIHFTPSFAYELTPEEWCRDVGNSLFDRMDEARPILVDQEAYVCTVALVATSDSFNGLMGSWNQFCSMLGAFTNLLFNQISSWPVFGDPFTVSSGVGQVPDWRSMKLADILPGMYQAADFMMGLLDSLKPTTQKSTLLDNFVAFLNQKILTLQMFGQKIVAVLGLITTILNIEGLYTLVIEGQGDAEWVRHNLMSATGGPHDYGKYDDNGNLLPVDQQKEANYTIGTVFLITGGSSAAVNILSSFFTGQVLPSPNTAIVPPLDLP